MTLPAPKLVLYQGDDWYTTHWSVAQVYDTLEQMREICLLDEQGETEGEPQAQRDLLEAIADLTDDLDGELDIVGADLMPLIQKNLAARMAIFEAQAYLDMLRRQLRPNVMSVAFSATVFEDVARLVAAIKDVLKKIDL